MYISLSGLEREAPAKLVQAITLCFACETLTIVENLGLTPEQRSSITAIVSANVDGQVNESVERRNFRRRVQQPGESFDDFLVSLRELAKTCKFCSDECVHKSIRDQIIEGVSDGNTEEELLKEKDLSLDAASPDAGLRRQPSNNGHKLLGAHRYRWFDNYQIGNNQTVVGAGHRRLAQGVGQCFTQGGVSSAQPLIMHATSAK